MKPWRSFLGNSCISEGIFWPRQRILCLVVFLISLLTLEVVGFVVRPGATRMPTTKQPPLTPSSSWFVLSMGVLPENYQQFGEETIRRVAADSCQITGEESLTIEWKPGRIIVTVYNDQVFVSNDEDDSDDDQIQRKEDEDDGADDDDDDGSDLDDSDEMIPATGNFDGLDVTLLAKAINNAFNDDGIGLTIAEVYEIEVTTPGAPDELSGIMWESYRGFDVICKQVDQKTKKVKTVEGRLVERTGDFTVINIKGRMKKMKNDTVLSVKLPKAKKEKGAA